MKHFLVIVVAVIIATAAFVVYRQRAQVYEIQNAALTEKVEQLENRINRLSSLESARSITGEQDQNQTLELMRLRNEVTQLRAENSALASEKARLAQDLGKRDTAAPSPVQNSAPSVAREHWSFRGYNSPEDALISGMAAMRDGQVENLLRTLTPEERQRFEAQNQGKTDEEIAARFQKEFGRVSGVRVLGRNQTAPNEVVLDVYLEGLGKVKKYRMTQVGQEWKAGEPINQNPQTNPEADQTSYDPLAFYRKNPELMKRYFPHLYKEDAQVQAQAAEGAQPAQPEQP